MRKIDKIIIHCSATPGLKNFDVKDIRDWHVNGNGWSDVGYHYVIKLDGEVQLGRPDKNRSSRKRQKQKFCWRLLYWWYG